MKHTKTKFNEIVIGIKFVNPVVKYCPRLSGWLKTTNILEDSISQIPEMVKGRTFPSCNRKGRIAEFRLLNKSFNKGIPINEVK